MWEGVRGGRRERKVVVPAVQVCSLETAAGQGAEEEKAACLPNVGRHGVPRTLVAAAVRSVWSWDTEGEMVRETRRGAWRDWEGWG